MNNKLIKPPDYDKNYDPLHVGYKRFKRDYLPKFLEPLKSIVIKTLYKKP